MVHRIELAFGHRRRDGELLASEQVEAAEQQALEIFSQLFRGGQIYRRLGGYLSDGYPILEPCSTVYSLADDVADQVGRLWSLAGDIARLLDQDFVLVSVVPVHGMIGWVPPSAA